MDLKEVDTVLNKFARYIVQSSKDNLTKEKRGDGKLFNSVNYELNQDQFDFLLSFFMEDYGKFQDQGVKGSNPSLVKNGKQKAPNSPYSYTTKMPPMKPLMSWAKSKNIRFRQGKTVNGKWKSTGRYAKGNYITIAFWLQKRIFAQGLKPSLFFTKPFEVAFQNLPNELMKGFSVDVENKIINAIKE